MVSDDARMEHSVEFYVFSVLGLAYFGDLGKELDDFRRVLCTWFTNNCNKQRTSLSSSIRFELTI